MNKPKDTGPGSPSSGAGGGVLRRVARFVTNPTTDWSKLGSRQDDSELEGADRAELRAMVERKRRNEFVRKREFDMLRRVRREGLSPEQAAAIDRASRLDEAEGRGDGGSGHRRGVKDKIDAIEQQMVGVPRPHDAPASTRPPATRPPVTGPSAFDDVATLPMGLIEPAPAVAAAPAPAPAAGEPLDFVVSDLPGLARPTPSPAGVPAPSVPTATASPAPAPAAAPRSAPEHDFTDAAGVPRGERLQPDPELDEAVIAFANADFAYCESVLAALTGHDGPRRQDLGTWLARFDLYRATGKAHEFDALAIDFALQFGRSAPQWVSLPQRLAESVRVPTPRAAGQGEVGWVCPSHLDSDAVAQLASQSLQMPQPWVFDWSGVEQIDPRAAHELTALMARWSAEDLSMRWLSGDRLLAVLLDATPTGVRDADPAFWMLRLEVLRLADQPDAFDEAAIDYCVTFEVSPPSWERARCRVRMAGPGLATQSTRLSMLGEAVTSFMESSTLDDTPAVEVVTLELSGQLVGDITTMLNALDAQLGSASLVRLNCGRLIRVDFVAAGDLLNWVLRKRSENRAVTLLEVHRLIGLFFGAMGLLETADVLALGD